MKRPDDGATARCREIQERLPGFLEGSLGRSETGEVQGHVLTCDECAAAYGDLLMRRVSGSSPPETPPFLPSGGLYTAYLRQRRGRAGVPWQSIREMLRTGD